mgnify:CR=1 FL=1
MGKAPYTFVVQEISGKIPNGSPVTYKTTRTGAHSFAEALKTARRLAKARSSIKSGAQLVIGHDGFLIHNDKTFSRISITSADGNNVSPLHTQ